MIGISACGQAELDAHQQGQDAAEHEEDDRREQELDADDLVIVEKTYLLRNPSSV